MGVLLPALGRLVREDPARTLDFSIVFPAHHAGRLLPVHPIRAEEVLWMIMWVSLLGVVSRTSSSASLPVYADTPLGWSRVEPTRTRSAGRRSSS
ncbi:MAG: hypothetical protein R2710_31435 [Acidimicrobiales bacterium]